MNKNLITYPGASNLRDMLQVNNPTRDYEGALREHRLEKNIFALSFGSFIARQYLLERNEYI